MYTIGITPLLRALAIDGAKQAWYADDASAGGKVLRLRNWWDRLTEKGPQFGYYPNPAKSILVVKPEFLNDATRIFDSTGVTIRSDGSRCLGAAIGSPIFQEFMQHKTQEWVSQTQRLSDFASTKPQAAYSVFLCVWPTE